MSEACHDEEKLWLCIIKSVHLYIKNRQTQSALQKGTEVCHCDTCTAQAIINLLLEGRALSLYIILIICRGGFQNQTGSVLSFIICLLSCDDAQ